MVAIVEIQQLALDVSKQVDNMIVPDEVLELSHETIANLSGDMLALMKVFQEVLKKQQQKADADQLAPNDGFEGLCNLAVEGIERNQICDVLLQILVDSSVRPDVVKAIYISLAADWVHTDKSLAERMDAVRAHVKPLSNEEFIKVLKAQMAVGYFQTYESAKRLNKFLKQYNKLQSIHDANMDKLIRDMSDEYAKIKSVLFPGTTDSGGVFFSAGSTRRRAGGSQADLRQVFDNILMAVIKDKKTRKNRESIIIGVMNFFHDISSEHAPAWDAQIQLLHNKGMTIDREQSLKAFRAFVEKVGAKSIGLNEDSRMWHAMLGKEPSKAAKRPGKK